MNMEPKPLSYTPGLATKTNANSTRKTEKKHRGLTQRWIVWTTVFMLWAALSYGSFALAHHYITGLHSQLNHIQQTNQKNVDQLNKSIANLQTQLNQNQENAQTLQQQFADVQKEMAKVDEQIALTGSTISSTDTTKQTLSERITDLSKQLDNLKAVIAKLEAAARVY